MTAGSSRASGGHPGPVPDSDVCRAAETVLRSTSEPALVNHCLRSYLWGVAVAEQEHLPFDPELLFVSAALHDLGLLPEFDTGAAFEIDSGTQARSFAAGHGWSSGRAGDVERSVVLHMAFDVTPDHGHEAYLLWVATSMDVSGTGLQRLSAATITQVMASYPRLDFATHFRTLFVSQASRKPFSAAAHCVQLGVLERLNTNVLDRIAADASPPPFGGGTPHLGQA